MTGRSRMRAASRAARLALASAYPFPIPSDSFLYRGGRAHPLAASDAADLARGRTPVIACGSNQSPEQLARKFGAFGESVTIPVVRARLADFDAVYSAHITSYGSIAATLQHAPGAIVELALLWLDDGQLAHMHTTEAPGENYAFVRLERIRLEPRGARPLASAYAYHSLHGCLGDEGCAVALSAVRAEGRAFAAADQRTMLERARRRFAPEAAFDDFVLENIENAEARRARTAALRADAVPFAWPHWNIAYP